MNTMSNNRKFIYSFPFIMLFIFHVAPIEAVWVWDAKTGKWSNPKYEVKATPQRQFEHAKDFERQKKWERAAREYQQLRMSYPRSKRAPEAILLEAESFEKAGYYYEAFLAYQVLIDKYPSYREMSEIVAEQYRIGNLYLSGEKRKVKYIKIAILSGMNQAIEIFEHVRDNLPFSDIADDAQFRIGLCYEKMKKNNLAIDAYRELLRKYQESELRDDAKYRIGMCSFNLSKGAEYDQAAAENAKDTFVEFLNEFPDSNRTEEVKSRIVQLKDREAKGSYDIALYYDKIKQYNAAIIYYEKVIRNYPESSLAGAAKEKVEKIKKKIAKMETK